MDFDGTITSKDSLLEFIRYSKGDASFMFGFLLNSPVLAAYKLGIISNQRAKEIVLKYFFGDTTVEDFESLCVDFMRERMPAILRPKAMKEIEKLKAAGAEVVVVSASPEAWLRKWCADLSILCIATRLAVSNNRISGRIEGLNCHGNEKVRRITELFDLDSYSSVYCYGDTPADKPMLSLGSIRFYRPFR